MKHLMPPILFESIMSFTLLLKKGIMKTLLLILPLVFSTGFSQDRYWYVFLSTGDTLSGMSLDSFSRDSLYVRDSIRLRSVCIDSIIGIRHFNGGGFWSGAKVGAYTGAIAGFLIGGAGGAVAAKQGGDPPSRVVVKIFAAIVVGTAGFIFGGVWGFITGGSIGSATSVDEEFYFSGFNHMGKLNVIYQLFQRQQQIK